MIETLLTLILPGLGHLYFGHYKKALFLIFLSIAGAFFIYLFILVYPYALYDIWKISKEKPEPKYKKSEAVLVIIAVLIAPTVMVTLLAVSAPSIIRWVKEEVVFPIRVEEEGKEIVAELEKYYRSKGSYPDNLTKIIGVSPIKKKWESDPWGHPYYYSTHESKKSYILLSYGPDGEKDTSDDFVLSD